MIRSISIQRIKMVIGIVQKLQNFQLKLDDSIENKVFRIIGKLDALAQSNKEISYHILANIKGINERMNSYVHKKLDQHIIGSASVNLVTFEKLPSFLKKIKEDLKI